MTVSDNYGHEQDIVSEVTFWKKEVEAWFEQKVHGRDTPAIIGIAGEVLIDFSESEDTWTENDVRHVRTCLIDHDMTVRHTREKHLRVEPSDKPCIPLQER